MKDEPIKIQKGRLEGTESVDRRFAPLSSAAVRNEQEVGFLRTVKETFKKEREVDAWHMLSVPPANFPVL